MDQIKNSDLAGLGKRSGQNISGQQTGDRAGYCTDTCRGE